MNICMVGTGYVGLVAGAGLADFGLNVFCIDNNKDKIERLLKGEVPIFETGLKEIVDRNVEQNRLHFSTDLREAVDKCQVIFLSVGTPERADGSSDLTAIKDIVKQIARFMTQYKIIAIKSTVPVGTAAELRRLIGENMAESIDFDIISNPEFLRQGEAVKYFMNPDRIILGGASKRALSAMREIYNHLQSRGVPIIETTNETAELIKYAANTFLALKISYINEIANLCELVSTDVSQVAIALGLDKRIGPKFLHPGPGFGGSCFPKDVKSLTKIAENKGYDFRLAETITEVNQRQRELVFQKCKAALSSLKNKKICLLGLSFKPDTDDIRESAAIYVAERLLKEGAEVRAYDPAAMSAAKSKLPKLRCFNDPYTGCEGADLLVVLTEWDEFRELQFSKIKSLMRIPIIFDTRNLYEGDLLISLGFDYICTGRVFD